MSHSVSRRKTLRGLLYGSLGMGLGAGNGLAEEPSPPASEPTPGICRLFPQSVEGPYYFDPALFRDDLTEGQAGVPMQLSLRVIEMGPCTPIAGARVDIWHANAAGIYSGYAHQGDHGSVDTVGTAFLRGTQVTSAQGDVSFRTIYPGWYPGRTPHIHIKVFLDRKTVLTGQLYFADAASARLYASHAPYAGRPRPDTTNATDWIFGDSAHDGGIVMLIDETASPLRASLVIAVDRSGDAARQGSGWLGVIRRRIGW